MTHGLPDLLVTVSIQDETPDARSPWSSISGRRSAARQAAVPPVPVEPPFPPCPVPGVDEPPGVAGDDAPPDGWEPAPGTSSPSTLPLNLPPESVKATTASIAKRVTLERFSCGDMSPPNPVSRARLICRLFG